MRRPLQESLAPWSPRPSEGEVKLSARFELILTLAFASLSFPHFPTQRRRDAGLEARR